MKSESIERRYKMNRNTTVVIKSKKMKDADVYQNTVTLIYATADVQPLELNSRSAIAHYIQDVDLDDDQVALFGGDKDD